MPQKRKASTIASAKIAEDAATNGSGSRKRKSDASLKGNDNNSNGNTHESEYQQHSPNNDESVIEESTSNNVDNVVDSEAPPDKRRKKDEGEEAISAESHQNGANGNIRKRSDTPDIGMLDLKRDDNGANGNIRKRSNTPDIGALDDDNGANGNIRKRSDTPDIGALDDDNGANDNIRKRSDTPDIGTLDLKRDDMSFVLTSQPSQDQMLIDDFIKQSEGEPTSSAPTDPHVDEHVTICGNETHENNESAFSQKSSEEEKKKELENKMPDNVYEKGHIVFLYRPKIGVEHPESVDDVQRMYAIIIPHFVRPSLKDEPIPSTAHLISHGEKVDEGKPKLGKVRSIIIGRKKLPEIEKHERFWAFVDKPFDNLDEVKEFVSGQEYTPGQKSSCRLLGRGVYYIVEHKGQTHLAYVLEFPEEPANVQKDFNIYKEGSYVISVKNPEQKNPSGLGLPDYEQVEYPAHLENLFQGKRFISLPSTEFLDYRGCEFLLIGASVDIIKEHHEAGKSLHDLLESEHVEEQFAEKEIFDELRLEKGTIPTEPTFHGMWR